jgi:transcriptional regulator with XRE-family HTH domain
VDNTGHDLAADTARQPHTGHAADVSQPGDPQLGQIFRRARRHRGWSLRDVERRTGIPNPHISQIERGQIRQPEAKALWALSELYSLDFTKIAIWSGHLGRDPEKPGAEILLLALRALRRLTPEAQVNAIRYLENMADDDPRP